MLNNHTVYLKLTQCYMLTIFQWSWEKKGESGAQSPPGKQSKHCWKLSLQYLCGGNCGLILNNKTVKYKNNNLSQANKCKALSAHAQDMICSSHRLQGKQNVSIFNFSFFTVHSEKGKKLNLNMWQKLTAEAENKDTDIFSGFGDEFLFDPWSRDQDRLPWRGIILGANDIKNHAWLIWEVSCYLLFCTQWEAGLSGTRDPDLKKKSEF